MPHLGFLKLRGSVETGFAQPTPANTMQSVPSRSKWRKGFSDSLPCCLAVGSPSSHAASAWPASWKRMTLKGAYAGVIVGGLTVLIWKQFAWFDLYELVPGFLFSVIAIVVVSLMDKEPSESIKKTFEKALALSK